MGRPRKTDYVPVDNCLECEFYDECEKYTSGKCLKKAKQREKKKAISRFPTYTYDGKTMRAKAWAGFLNIKYEVVYPKLKKYGSRAIKMYFAKEYEEAKNK